MHSTALHIVQGASLGRIPKIQSSDIVSSSSILRSVEYELGEIGLKQREKTPKGEQTGILRKVFWERHVLLIVIGSRAQLYAYSWYQGSQEYGKVVLKERCMEKHEPVFKTEKLKRPGFDRRAEYRSSVQTGELRRRDRL